MPTPSESLREQVFDSIADALAAITAGGTYWYTPANVFRYDLPDVDAISFPTYVVADDSETVDRLTKPLAHRSLTVTVSAVHMAQIQDGPDRVARRLLQDIQTAVLADPTRGGLAVDTREVSSRLDIAGPNEPQVMVEATFTVQYRTALANPASGI